MNNKLKYVRITANPGSRYCGAILFDKIGRDVVFVCGRYLHLLQGGGFIRRCLRVLGEVCVGGSTVVLNVCVDFLVLCRAVLGFVYLT